MLGSFVRLLKKRIRITTCSAGSLLMPDSPMVARRRSVLSRVSIRGNADALVGDGQNRSQSNCTVIRTRVGPALCWKTLFGKGRSTLLLFGEGARNRPSCARNIKNLVERFFSWFRAYHSSVFERITRPFSGGSFVHFSKSFEQMFPFKFSHYLQGKRF